MDDEPACSREELAGEARGRPSKAEAESPTERGAPAAALIGRSEFATKAVLRCTSRSLCTVAQMARDHRCFAGRPCSASTAATLAAADAC